MLEFNCVSKAYGEKKVLDNFSLILPDCGTVAILGQSGCGKTTLLRLIAGLEKPDGGNIVLPDNAKISMVFQEDRLLEALDVRGNVLIALDGDGESQRLADECLERCELSDVSGNPVSSLSGGMRRRVAIARAMAFGGGILLLDEPFKGLDDETKRRTCDFVFGDGDKRLTIFVTHDKDDAETYAKMILRFAGPPLELMEDER